MFTDDSTFEMYCSHRSVYVSGWTGERVISHCFIPAVCWEYIRVWGCSAYTGVRHLHRIVSTPNNEKYHFIFQRHEATSGLHICLEGFTLLQCKDPKHTSALSRTTWRPKKTKENWLSWTFLRGHLSWTLLNIYGGTWSLREPSTRWHHKFLCNTVPKKKKKRNENTFHLFCQMCMRQVTGNAVPCTACKFLHNTVAVTWPQQVQSVQCVQILRMILYVICLLCLHNLHAEIQYFANGIKMMRMLFNTRCEKRGPRSVVLTQISRQS